MFFSKSAQDTCLINYTTINDANGVRDLNNSVKGGLCDNTMTPGWYRWLLRGQDAIIPTSCTPVSYRTFNASDSGVCRLLG